MAPGLPARMPSKIITPELPIDERPRCRIDNYVAPGSVLALGQSSAIRLIETGMHAPRWIVRVWGSGWVADRVVEVGRRARSLFARKVRLILAG